MFKRVINAVIGSRHERDRKKIQPIVDEINEHFARLKHVSDDELRAQTAKFRETIRERTGELEKQVTELRERKRDASDIVERDRIDVELGGADGRGGVEGKLREVTADPFQRNLPVLLRRAETVWSPRSILGSARRRRREIHRRQRGHRAPAAAVAPHSTDCACISRRMTS